MLSATMLPTVMLVVDGPPDAPEDDFDGRSPLQCAAKPRLDRLARHGRLRSMRWDPPEGAAQPDAWSALAGFVPPVSPARGPLEASALEVPLSGRDLAFSAPILTGDPDHVGGVARVWSATDIAEATAALEPLWSRRFRWFAEPAASVLRWTDGVGRSMECRTPEQAIGAPLGDAVPVGDGAEDLERLIWDSAEILTRLPGNRRRVDQGGAPWLCLWPFGPGAAWVPAGRVPPGWSAVGAEAAFLGLARSLGMRPVSVAATYDIESACRERVAAAETRLIRGDSVVWVHLARTADDPDRRLEEIEAIDRDLIGGLEERLRARESQARFRVAWGGGPSIPVLDFDPLEPFEGRLPFDARGFADVRVELGPDHLWRI